MGSPILEVRVMSLLMWMRLDSICVTLMYLSALPTLLQSLTMTWCFLLYRVWGAAEMPPWPCESWHSEDGDLRIPINRIEMSLYNSERPWTGDECDKVFLLPKEMATGWTQQRWTWDEHDRYLLQPNRDVSVKLRKPWAMDRKLERKRWLQD